MVDFSVEELDEKMNHVMENVEHAEHEELEPHSSIDLFHS